MARKICSSLVALRMVSKNWPKASFCDGHGPETEGESPSQALLEGIGSICNCTNVKKLVTLGTYPRGRVEWKQTANRSTERK